MPPLKSRPRAPERHQGACQDLPRQTARLDPRIRKPPDPGAPEDVRGYVFLPNGDDPTGVVVRVEGREVRVDGEGAFVFPKVPATYDLTIADPDRRRATLYQGLTRRDPIVAHTAHDSTTIKRTCHQASIAGWVRRDGMDPKETVPLPRVYFLSPEAFAWDEQTGTLPRQRAVPIRSLRVDWLGKGATTGMLVALSRGKTRFYLATAPVTLSDGESGPHDLRLEPVPTGRLAGRLGTRTFYPDHVQVSFAPTGSAERIDLGDCDVSKEGAFECTVPDLTALGGEYCVSQGNGPGQWLANRCGAALGTTGLLVEPAPWELRVEPSHRSSFPDGAMVSWKATGTRLYRLDIGTCLSGTCAVVYLATPMFGWAAFQSLGLAYQPLIEKNVAVSAMHPYQTVDQVASGHEALGMLASWHRVLDDSLILTLPGDAGNAEGDPGFRLIDAKASPPPKTTLPMAWAEAEALPACATTEGVIAFGAMGPALLETRIRVRGILTTKAESGDPLDCARAGRKEDRSTPSARCWGAWILADPDGVYRAIEFHPSDPTPTDGPHCGEPHAPRVDAIVTGVVVPCGGFGFCRDGHPPCPADHCLTDVSLCAIRGDSR